MKFSRKIMALMSALILTMSNANMVQADEATEDSPSIEDRMQRLEDREAIRELLVTYGRLLDKKDLVGYSKLFAEDGV
ncbi:MAG: nuclear transport factor 2 family protein, partial [Gammaproteobacteria bacterium]